MLNLVHRFMIFIAKEVWSFFLKELRACLFAGLFLLTLLASNHIPLFGLPRYDFLFLAAIAIQAIMIGFKLETKDEAKTIFLFHIIGFVLEVYKTSPMVGSWAYPEFGYIKLLGVPLYSCFMYAAVGSYIAHAWKALKLRLEKPPSYLVPPGDAPGFRSLFILVMPWNTDRHEVEARRRLKFVLRLDEPKEPAFQVTLRF